MSIPMSRRTRYRLTKKVYVMRRDGDPNSLAYTDDEGYQVCAAYADIRPTSGSETERSEQMTGTTVYNVTIRWPGQLIKTGDWIEYGSTKLNIFSLVDVDGEGQYLRMVCRTKDVAAGEDTTR